MGGEERKKKGRGVWANGKERCKTKVGRAETLRKKIKIKPEGTGRR